MKEKSPLMEENNQSPSFPSNYVTFLQLKQRYLQQQSAKSDSSFTVKPQNDAVSGGTNRNRFRNQSNQSNHDSDSKNPNETVSGGRNRNRIANQRKPEASGSEIRNDVVSRGRNRRTAVNQLKPDVPVSDSVSKTVTEVADNNPVADIHPMVEKKKKKKENDTDKSNSKLSKKKNGYRNRNPRFVSEQNQTGGSIEPESEPVQEKKQHRNDGRRDRNRKKEAREPKGKTASFDQNQNECVVVEAVTADVEEMKVADVDQGINRRQSCSGRFNGGIRNGGGLKYPVRVKKAVWVKKGECATN